MLSYLEFCLSGVFSCRILHLSSIWARSSVQSARGSGRRETPSAGQVTCIFCWQRMVKSCHMCSTSVCEIPEEGIRLGYTPRCPLSPIFRCFSNMVLALLYLPTARMKSRTPIVPSKVSLSCQSAHRPQKCTEGTSSCYVCCEFHILPQRGLCFQEPPERVITKFLAHIQQSHFLVFWSSSF